MVPGQFLTWTFIDRTFFDPDNFLPGHLSTGQFSTWTIFDQYMQWAFMQCSDIEFAFFQSSHYEHSIINIWQAIKKLIETL